MTKTATLQTGEYIGNQVKTKKNNIDPCEDCEL